MAHYVFQRNNGYGDYDYIRNFETMEITDYKEYAAQVDDKYMGYLDIPYLNSLGFFAIGISRLALRIIPDFLFVPRIRGFRPTVMPRAPRARGAAPMPRPVIVPVPAPRPAPRPRPAPAPRPAPRPAPAGPGALRPARRGPGGKGPGGRGPGR